MEKKKKSRMRIPLWAAFGAAAGAAMGTLLDNLVLSIGLIVVVSIGAAVVSRILE